MKTAEARDTMVKRVQAAHKKWPSFEKMPLSDKTKVLRVSIKDDPSDNTNYVAALYELCAKGATVVGRARGRDAVVVGEPDDPALLKE